MAYFSLSRSGAVWPVLSTIIDDFVGITLLANPAFDVSTLTIPLVAYFPANGVSLLALAELLWVGFPTMALWVFGLLFGVKAAVTGVPLIAIARGHREKATIGPPRLNEKDPNVDRSLRDVTITHFGGENERGWDNGFESNDGEWTMNTSTAVRRDRFALWVAMALMVAILGYVVWRYLGTIVLGLFLYYVTRPVLSRFVDRIPSRTLAVATALVAVSLPVLFLVGWTLAIAVQQLTSIGETDIADRVQEFIQPYFDLPTVVEEANRFIERLVADPSILTNLQFSDELQGLYEVVSASLEGVARVAINLFVVLIIAFYLLRDDYRIAGWARSTFLAKDGIIEAYFRAVDRDLKNVYFGNILNALLTGILGAVTYNLLNLVAPSPIAIPQPTLLGLLTGVASLVPVIGMKLVWVPMALYLLVISTATAPRTVWFVGLFAVVSTVIVDYIPDQLLRPYVSGRTLHVGAVMLAYIFGPLLFGWYGIFFGPLLLVVVYEFGIIVVPWLFHPERDWQANDATPEIESDPSPVDSAPDDSEPESAGEGVEGSAANDVEVSSATGNEETTPTGDETATSSGERGEPAPERTSERVPKDDQHTDG